MLRLVPPLAFLYLGGGAEEEVSSGFLLSFSLSLVNGHRNESLGLQSDCPIIVRCPPHAPAPSDRGSQASREKRQTWILSAGRGAVPRHGKVDFWKTDNFDQSRTTDMAWVSLNPWLPFPDKKLLTPPKWGRAGLPSLRKAKELSTSYFHRGGDGEAGRIGWRRKDTKNIFRYHRLTDLKRWKWTILEMTRRKWVIIERHFWGSSEENLSNISHTLMDHMVG